MHRRLLLLVSLGSIWSAPALACRCKSPAQVQEAFRRAHAVVRATVVQLTPVPSRRGSHAKLAVARAWKRRLPAKLTIHSLDLCAFPMKKGEEYLLFLVQDGRDYVTTRCMGNQRVVDADESLVWLQENADATVVKQR